jgi:Sulfatase
MNMRMGRALAAAAMVAIGALLGYVAASGRLNSWQRAAAESFAPKAAADKPSAPAKGRLGCCDGVTKGQFVAMADPNVQEAVATAQEQPGTKPNILVIWGDDIGISNISAYSDGLMGYTTPNIDRIAKEGVRFLHYYGEQSCTAGRAAFLTG